MNTSTICSFVAVVQDDLGLPHPSASMTGSTTNTNLVRYLSRMWVAISAAGA